MQNNIKPAPQMPRRSGKQYGLGILLVIHRGCYIFMQTLSHISSHGQPPLQHFMWNKICVANRNIFFTLRIRGRWPYLYFWTSMKIRENYGVMAVKYVEGEACRHHILTQYGESPRWASSVSKSRHVYGLLWRGYSHLCFHLTSSALWL